MKGRSRQDDVQRAADKLAMALPALFTVAVAFTPGDPGDPLNPGDLNVGAHCPDKPTAIKLLREAADALEGGR
jgi:hypothetical protein